MSLRIGEVITIDWLFNEFKKAIKQAGGEPTEDKTWLGNLDAKRD